MAQQRQHPQRRRLSLGRSGIYAYTSPRPPKLILWTVLRSPLHHDRCFRIQWLPPQRLELPHQLRRLDPRHLLFPRHARHQ